MIGLTQNRVSLGLLSRGKHTLFAAMTLEAGICPPKTAILLAGERSTKVYRVVSGLNEVFRMTNLKLNLFAVVLFAVALFTVSQNAFAQQPIGAGGIIQQIPQAPVTEKSVPNLPIERPEAPGKPVAPGVRFVVNQLHVTGQTHFSEAELVAAMDFRPGGELDLAELRALASKMTELYNLDGYFVAQAYLPPQDIKDGVVTIAVIEGRYGKISVLNQTNVWDGVIERVLDGLNIGDPVVSAPLERRLLLLSDLPGVAVKSTLTPGSAVGTSDLTVNTTPEPRVNGSLEADNAGNPYTGAHRVGASVNLNEPFGYGDVLGARFLTSRLPDSSGSIDYGRVFYQAQVWDATVGAAYTIFDYRLGGKFSSLHASGSEQIASLYSSYPLIRSYNDNLYALLGFDHRTFQDKIGVTFSTIDKEANVLNAGLSGRNHDDFGGGGWNVYSLAGTFGNLDIQSPLARAADAATARTNGAYGKLSGSVSRLQHVIGPLSLYGAVRGQFAANNLDISEKMELGGMYGVRAYPEGEAYGDHGYIATLEARLLLPKWLESLPGETQLISFVDTGSVAFNKSPWLPGHNEATRSGAGVGLTWVSPNDVTATVFYAHRIGPPATSAPDHGRFWVQLVKYF
jgi:hemolysin activation/secretion protein